MSKSTTDNPDATTTGARVLRLYADATAVPTPCIPATDAAELAHRLAKFDGTELLGFWTDRHRKAFYYYVRERFVICLGDSYDSTVIRRRTLDALTAELWQMASAAKPGG